MDNQPDPEMRSWQLHLQSYKRGLIKDLNLRFCVVDFMDFKALTTFSNLYDVKTVSEVDACVQAVLAMQRETVKVLLTTMEMIERDDLDNLPLCCDSATHRSV